MVHRCVWISQLRFCLFRVSSNADFWNVGSRLRTWRISCCAAPRFEIPIMWLGWLCHLASETMRLCGYHTFLCWIPGVSTVIVGAISFFYMFFSGFLDCSGRAGAPKEGIICQYMIWYVIIIYDYYYYYYLYIIIIIIIIISYPIRTVGNNPGTILLTGQMFTQIVSDLWWSIPDWIS